MIFNAYYKQSVTVFCWLTKLGRGFILSAIFTKRFLLILIAVILITVLFYFILPVSVPLVIAFITALILEPAVKLLQIKIKISRRISVLITFLGFVLFIGLSGYFITTKVITEAIKLVENAPMYINEITKAWLRAEADFSNAAKDLPKDLVNEISIQIQSFLNKTKDDLVSYVDIDSLKALLTNIPNYLVSFIVYLIALFLFLIDLPRLRKGLYNHLTEKTADKVKFMTSRLFLCRIWLFQGSIPCKCDYLYRFPDWIIIHQPRNGIDHVYNHLGY